MYNDMPNGCITLKTRLIMW